LYKIFDHIANEYENNPIYETILREGLTGPNHVIRAKILESFRKKVQATI